MGASVPFYPQWSSLVTRTQRPETVNTAHAGSNCLSGRVSRGAGAVGGGGGRWGGKECGRGSGQLSSLWEISAVTNLKWGPLWLHFSASSPPCF